MSKRVVIVGAGAAGLMAAGRAAELGAKVLLLEKMKLPGRKIGISGKGRCNLTNTAELSEFIGHFGKNGRFLRQAFTNFFSEELINFFEDHGFPLQIERGGRVFPVKGKNAVDVVKLLEKWILSKGCKLQKNTTLKELVVSDGKIQKVITEKGSIHCDCLIMATGGASYPRTGSTGEGYTLLEKIGHSIVPLRPALVSLHTSPPPAADLDGLQLKNTRARLFIDNKRKAENFGELHYTRSGISGPIILSLSQLAVDALAAGSRVKIVLDCKPALDDKQLDTRLQKDLTQRHAEPLSSILRGLLPKQLINTCLAENKLDGNKTGGEVSAKERKRLGNWFKNSSFDISGHGGFNEAIVTAGGIQLKEVNPKTMESKIIDGLYIVGELLDINGDTGGFNLQAAFSTGWLAGQTAAEQ